MNQWMGTGSLRFRPMCQRASVATPGTMNTSVTTSQTDVAQFTVVDVGSDWSYTTVTHRLKHKGKNMTIVHKAKMSNKQPPKIK